MWRRLAPILGTAALAALAAACSREADRDLAPYYDEQGLFTLNLPAANDVTVTPPQPAQDGPGLLTGVVSSPPAPTAAPQTAVGPFDPAAEEPDQTIYQAFAVTSDGFEDLDEMALYFLTGDPVVDVLIDDPVRLDGDEARLIVADIRRDDQVTATVAAAMTLGDGEMGYLVAAVFPPGTWEAERSDFEEIVGSFSSDLPPGLKTFPVTGQAP